MPRGGSRGASIARSRSHRKHHTHAHTRNKHYQWELEADNEHHHVEESEAVKEANYKAATELIQKEIQDAFKVKGPALHAEGLVRQGLANKIQKELKDLAKKEEDEKERLQTIGKKKEETQEAIMATKVRMDTTKGRIAAIDRHGQADFKAKQMQHTKDRLCELRETLEEMQSLYTTSRDALMEKQKDWKFEVHRLEQEIDMIEHQKRGEPFPPGPYCLRWVDSDWFHIMVLFVTLCNLMIMLMAFVDDSVEWDLPELFFLLFYVLELVLHLTFFQWTFFTGALSKIFWNSLDVIIVVSGVAEFTTRWCMDGVKVSNHGGFRFFMVLRLMRVMKFLHVGLLVDLSWVEGDIFQTCMMGIIGVNCITMGLEMDNKGFFMWPYMNNMFCMIYVVELLAKIKHHRWAFFWSANVRDMCWNYLETVIVIITTYCFLIGPVIQQVQRLTGQPHPRRSQMSKVITVLRLTRFARILRLADMVKSVPPLYLLVVGIATAMKGAGWVLFLTGGVLYICALLGVRFIKQGFLPSDLPEEAEQEVTQHWGSIPNAIFNLFKTMNGDLSGVQVMVDHVACMPYVVMIFMVITNWALFSILTAVVCDKMALVKQAYEAHKEQEGHWQKEEERAMRLKKIFANLDADGNGQVDFDEFRGLMSDVEGAEELSRSAGLPGADLKDLFVLFANEHGDGKGQTIKLEDFIHLLTTECTGVTVRSMMQIEKNMRNIHQELKGTNFFEHMPLAASPNNGQSH